MRNPVFDLLRIILTLLVVNVHIRIITGIKPNFLEPFTWYTVPIFIVMSFYFANNKNLGSRLKRLLMPLIFWSAIGFAIHPNLINLKNIFLQLFTGHVVNTPLYYLVLLIWFTLINWVISRTLLSKDSPYKKVSVYSLIVLGAFYLEYSSINYNFFLPMITVVEKSYGRFAELIKYVPVGLMFAYLSRKKIKKFFLFFSFISLLAAVFFYKIPKPPDFHYSGLDLFFGTAAIFSFVLWNSKIKIKESVSKPINFIGKYSLGVYLLHYLLLELFFMVFPQVKNYLNSTQIPFLLFFTFANFLLCYLIDVATKRKFSYLLK